MIRTLTFKKEIKDLGDNTYKTVSDAELIATLINLCHYYCLKIIKINIEDFYFYEVKVWGKKQYFLSMVEAFIKKYESHIKNIGF